MYVLTQCLLHVLYGRSLVMRLKQTVSLEHTEGHKTLYTATRLGLKEVRCLITSLQNLHAWDSIYLQMSLSDSRIHTQIIILYMHNITAAIYITLHDVAVCIIFNDISDLYHTVLDQDWTQPSSRWEGGA